MNVSISHIWKSHGENEPPPQKKWFTHHIWIPYVHTWMKNFSRMSVPCPTHRWVMTHIWTSHLTHTHTCTKKNRNQYVTDTYGSFTCVLWPIFFLGSLLTHMWDMTHSCMHICDLGVARAPMSVTWLFHMCGMAYSCVWRDSFMCVTWLIYMCDMTHPYVWHVWFIYMWFGFGVCTHMCGMTHSYVWHDTFIRVTCLIHMWFGFGVRKYVCDKTHVYLWHGSRMWHASSTCGLDLRCAPMCDMTHSYVKHDTFTCVTWLIRVCDMIDPYVWHVSPFLI